MKNTPDIKDRPSAGRPDPFLQAKFHNGQLLQAQGRVAEAAQLYDEILAADGAHFDALHSLGVILLQTGKELGAVELLSRAIAAQPEAAQPHSNLGYAFLRLNRLEEALASYDRAIALKPDYARAHFNRGHVLLNLGRREDALASFSRAAQHDPDYVQAHFHRAITLMDLGRFAEALESFDRTLTLQPGHAEAHYNRGNVLYGEARYSEALAAYEKAVALKPDFAKAWCNRGNALGALKRRPEALASYDRAVALNPHEAQFYYDRATVLQSLHCFADSLADWDRVLARDPLNAKAHVNRGIVLHMMKRFGEAIASCDRAIALQPDLAAAYVNKGMSQLTIEDFIPGWENFEWRRRLKASTERKLAEPPLKSLADAKGKTILVHCDDGFGDTIQFCRYVPLLQQAGARVLLSPQKKLDWLMRTLEGVTIAGEGDVFDYHIASMSLPLLFQTTLKTIPASVPYLFADPTRIEKWRKRIGGKGFKIGICWQGDSAHAIVDGRCCALADFAPLARLPGVRLISLHKGTGEAQLKTLPDGMTVEHFDDLDTGPDAFADTAAVMQCMDLVITIDTSVVHLAGALGVHTWALLQYVPEWRWLLDRSDSPWYPGMRLFRQKTDSDWAGLFQELEAALAALLPKAAPQAADAEAHTQRGIVLHGMRRFDEALGAFDHAIALKPDSAEAWSWRGLCLLDMDRADEAVEAYDRVVALEPDDAQAHYERANLLYLLGRHEEALAAYEKVIALKPGLAQAWCNRGNVLLALRRREEALTSLDRAIVLQPREAQFHCDRATALQALDRFGEALAECDCALALAPMDVRSHTNRGITLYLLRRFEEAIAACDRALALQPDFTMAHVNKAVARLTMGQLAAWKDFEWRRRLKATKEPKFAQPPLTDLADARGKTVLVHCCDGFGDTIQFSRYLPLFKEAGVRVLLSPPKKLEHLMRTLMMGPGDGAIIAGETDAFDYHIPAMSLPMLFQPTLDTIPAELPYLSADAARIEKWRKRIGDEGFKIGICWQGNSVSELVDRRCCDVAHFAPLAHLSGVRLISLHKGTGERQLDTLPDGMTVEHFDDLDLGPDAFADTAAVMQCLDLVISIDTSVVHLAGALGVRCWTLLPYLAEWRWLLDRTDTPWYPGMRLFRQKSNGDWTGLFDDVKAALACLLKENT